MAPRAVAVVVDDGAVLVVHRLRDGAAYYTLPGGSVEDGESIEQACIRELREETGLHGRIVRQIMTLDNRGRTEHYVLMTAERGELRVGEPEASRMTATNRYRPMWLPLSELADVDLRPDEARNAVMRLRRSVVPGIDASRALTFGAVAEEYARWRPSYPVDAVDWLAPAAPARVADVGAGTGKLTSLLVDRGLVVEAVEPDPRMLTALTQDIPEARSHQSTSDALPFADASVDAVLAADAWHWFPVETTIAEVRRVLKPGGWLGLVWNLVTPVQPWEYELAGVDPDRKGTSDSVRPPLPFPPGETQYATFPWVWEITPEHYIANLATTSAVLAMTPSQRQSTLDAARSVVAQATAESRGSTLSFHHSAACARWTPAER